MFHIPSVAIAVLEESTYAILGVPAMLAFPLLMLVAMFLYLAFWVVSFLVFFALHSYVCSDFLIRESTSQYVYIAVSTLKCASLSLNSTTRTRLCIHKIFVTYALFRHMYTVSYGWSPSWSS